MKLLTVVVIGAVISGACALLWPQSVPWSGVICGAVIALLAVTWE